MNALKIPGYPEIRLQPVVQALVYSKNEKDWRIDIPALAFGLLKSDSSEQEVISRMLYDLRHWIGSSIRKNTLVDFLLDHGWQAVAEEGLKPPQTIKIDSNLECRIILIDLSKINLS